VIALAAVAATLPTFAGDAAADTSLGAGVHYLRNLGDIEDNGFEKGSISVLGSLQFGVSMLKLEADLEYMFDLMGTDQGAWLPQAYVLVGGMIYGGLGIGTVEYDGEWSNDPFYNLRAGVELPLSAMALDLYATYQFWNDDQLESLTGDDLDSITFAGVLRF
jgi:hypothetical protein